MKKITLLVALTVSLGLLGAMYATPASAFIFGGNGPFGGLGLFGGNNNNCAPAYCAPAYCVPMCAPYGGPYYGTCCPPCKPPCKPVKKAKKAKAKK